MPTPAITLPLEIHRIILQFVDSDDYETLRLLSLASSTTRNEAERVLYRNILKPRHVARFVLFYRTVGDSSRLARLVRSLRLTIPDMHPGLRQPIITSIESTWNLLPSALRSLVNLKHLAVYGARKQLMGSRLPVMFEGCPFQLESLCCGDATEPEDLVSFLETQKSLRFLNLTTPKDEITSSSSARLPARWASDFPAAALQSLTSLQGNLDAIQSFLPGRSITVLHWLPYTNDEIRQWSLALSSISTPLRHIRRLTLGTFYIRRPESPLAKLCEHLPNLVCLHLVSLAVSII